ncbi:MAG TPA: sugar transferase [Candidatus Dormibacteraeota bacterium]|nr:sugar transferase [Candidatus Dormibacteraeota bacterium]
MKNNASVIYNACLVIGDFLALVSAFVIAYILRVSISHRALATPVHARTYLTIFVSLLPFWILIFALLGLYNARTHENRFSELGRLFVGSFIGILFIISYSYMTVTPIFPARLVTVYGFGLAFFFVLLFRTTARGLRRELFSYGIGINNTLIVGDTPISQILMDSLANSTTSGYRVLGIVGGLRHQLKPATDYQQFPNFETAIASLGDQPLHTIIQTELYASSDRNDEILTYAQEHHVAYRFVPGNSELFVGNIEVDLFRGVPIIAVHQTALTGWGRIVKRLSDIFFGSILLVLASPLMLVIGFFIKLSDGGPVFFRQVRLTRFNQKFKVFKFRSNNLTYNGLSPEAAFQKMNRPDLIKTYRANGDFIENDPRVTPLGHFLRRTSLDELPQLFNVVRGDISLVGPRALIPEELAIYSKRHTILSVKSGLTGLAQVSGRRDISYQERRKLDLYYVQNWSWWGDIVIFVKTIWVVFFHRGIRA